MLNANVTMSRGKAAAQAVHAALLLLDVHPNTPVIVIGGSPGDLAREGEVEVRDAGRTEVEPGTLTAVAFWNDDERVNTDDKV